jgi:transcriptional/translational regulatory protein YebC/TACO1
LLSKHGGNLAESGSVAWMFERKGILTVPKKEISDMEEFELMAIDAGAEDIKDDTDPVEIITEPDQASDSKGTLEENGYSVSYQLTYLPKNTIAVTGEDAEKLVKLLNYLEDNDDVQEVYGNFDIDDAEMESLVENLA